MIERRSAVRETKLERAIQTRVHLPDGISLSGALKDLSGAGCIIMGDTGGLSVGDEFTVALSMPGGCQAAIEGRGLSTSNPDSASVSVSGSFSSPALVPER